MPDFAYPSNDLQNVPKLLGMLGSFWSNTYQGREQVEDVVEAKAALAAQTHLKMLDLVSAVSRFNIPIWQTENWHLLTFKESDLNTGKAALLTYDIDTTTVYDSGTDKKYGVPIKLERYAWDLPADLKSTSMLFNRITDPTVTMTLGVDYLIEDGSIFFYSNPFDNSLIEKADIFAGGLVDDRQISLWAFHGQFDWDAIYTQFGNVLGLKLESSEGYKELVNAVFDALIEGTTVRHVRAALGAAAGVPLVREAVETVEQLLIEPARKLVITDQHAYEFSDQAAFTVAIGDELAAGDTMTDTLEFFEFNRGQTPNAAAISAMAMGRGFLAPGYFQELVFDNEDKELKFSVDADGKVKLSWSLGGWPADVTKFFEDLHANGVEDGKTMANLLDPRIDPDTEPMEATLPATINPMQFLCENVLRDNAIAVKIKAKSFGANATGLNSVKILRKIVPPHTAIIVLAELAYADEPIIMEGAGTILTPGYTETGSVYLSSEFAETINPLTSISESIRVKQIGGGCR